MKESSMYMEYLVTNLRVCKYEAKSESLYAFSWMLLFSLRKIQHPGEFFKYLKIWKTSYWWLIGATTSL